MTAAYFDHNATTPLDPRVRERILPWLGECFGNAASRHSVGRRAREAVEAAREQVARAIGAHAPQVVFTSGGTEANNTAIRGICTGLRPSRLLTSAIEHPCVARPAAELRSAGWQHHEIGVDALGRLDFAALEQLTQERVGLVSVMLANNETGVIQDVAALTRLVRPRGILVHTDAVQALGKIAVDFAALGVNALSVSAHKVGGPQGVGALILDKKVLLKPLMMGGGHERGLRAGTLNVAGIVGFGAACELAAAELAQNSLSLQQMQQRLDAGLRALGATIFGEGAARLPNTTYFAFPRIDGDALVMGLDQAGFAVASGSACSSESDEPSHVLLAMGVPAELARGAVRVSLGKGNDPAQIEAFLGALGAEVDRLSRMTALAR